MNRTGIEYLDFTWTPYSGCRNHLNGICGGGGRDFRCWAKTMTERFKSHYPYGFEPTFYPECLGEPARVKRPSRIGVSFMGDLFGDWEIAHHFPQEGIWSKTSMEYVKGIILRIVRETPWHTFVFLTKCPWNLPKWNSWPENAWVGVSVNDELQWWRALTYLPEIKATAKFLSFEPLLAPISVERLLSLSRREVDWVIIGGATRPTKLPELGWVQEIEEATDREGIPVFEKNNLARLLNRPLRQESPKEAQR